MSDDGRPLEERRLGDRAGLVALGAPLFLVDALEELATRGQVSLAAFVVAALQRAASVEAHLGDRACLVALGAPERLVDTCEELGARDRVSLGAFVVAALESVAGESLEAHVERMRREIGGRP